MRSIDILASSRPGETMWVLGNGPSLTRWIADAVDGSRAIGVNRILRWRKHDDSAVIVPAYVLLIDWEVWKQESERIAASRCRLIVGDVLTETARKMGLPIPDGSYCFTVDPNGDPGAPYGPLSLGYLSGYYAAEIAARMVYPRGRVILAGMDLNFPDGGDSHCYGDGRALGSTGRRFAEGADALCRLREAMSGMVEFRVAGESRLLRLGFEKLRKTF